MPTALAVGVTGTIGLVARRGKRKGAGGLQSTVFNSACMPLSLVVSEVREDRLLTHTHRRHDSM
jgi:hypothetical protein